MTQDLSVHLLLLSTYFGSTAIKCSLGKTFHSHLQMYRICCSYIYHASAEQVLRGLDQAVSGVPKTDHLIDAHYDDLASDEIGLPRQARVGCGDSCSIAPLST